MWDAKAVARYENWFQTREGSFAYMAEKRLISRLISGWPRRGHSLLEIGCGTGLFLEAFWEAGFDISGLDSSQHMLDAARQRLGHRADLHLGNAECLPFEDREFDFVALLTMLEFLDDPLAVLREACRVARKGLLVAFLNKYSLYYLSHGLELPFLRRSTLRRARWRSPWEMRTLLQQATERKHVVLRSVLPGPMWSWRRTPPLHWLNRSVMPLWLGAYCGARVDLIESAPLTPLLLFTSEKRVANRPAQAAF